MKKKFRRGASKRSRPSRQEKQLRTWSGRSPISETEYPFGTATFVGGFSAFLQWNAGPGIRIDSSTGCISAANTIDSLLLTILGEQFREFFPDEMPWLSRTAREICAALRFEEKDVEELTSSFARLAKSGFIDLDTSISGIYRYRLDVQAVRQAKNKHYVPMSELEWIDDEYIQRFPDPPLQQRAFAYICGRNVALGRLLLNFWHLSLNETTRAAMRDPEQGLTWIDIEHYRAFKDEPLFEKDEHKQQALKSLRQKRFLEVRQGKQTTPEYRPNAKRIWEALNALPQEIATDGRDRC